MCLNRSNTTFKSILEWIQSVRFLPDKIGRNPSWRRLLPRCPPCARGWHQPVNSNSDQRHRSDIISTGRCSIAHPTRSSIQSFHGATSIRIQFIILTLKLSHICWTPMILHKGRIAEHKSWDWSVFGEMRSLFQILQSVFESLSGLTLVWFDF